MAASVLCPSPETAQFVYAQLSGEGGGNGASGYITVCSGGSVPTYELNTASSSASLTEADISVLLSLALGIFAMAWGFKTLGKLLFKDA